jgi:hypothetical protein
VIDALTGVLADVAFDGATDKDWAELCRRDDTADNSQSEYRRDDLLPRSQTLALDFGWLGKLECRPKSLSNLILVSSHLMHSGKASLGDTVAGQASLHSKSQLEQARLGGIRVGPTRRLNFKWVSHRQCGLLIRL